MDTALWLRAPASGFVSGVRSLALAAASNKRATTPGLTLRAISGTDCGFHEPTPSWLPRQFA